MAASLSNSEYLYHLVKKHFSRFIGERAVIEMSKRPMSEWRAHVMSGVEDLHIEKMRLSHLGASFAIFEVRNGMPYFMYNDESMLKLENLKTCCVEYFQDILSDQQEIAYLYNEVYELKKLLMTKN